RGEVGRLVVLCPPQLGEQWQGELKDKFHIEAELLLPSTARRLEKRCRRLDESVFDVYPHLIVSTDYIKADRRRDEFLRACPNFVIVDEAHTFAFAGAGRGGQHQRHQLLKGLAARKERHLLLVTATPHSGKEDAFRSLLGFLNPHFVHLPADLSGPQNAPQRRLLAQHFVQRRRADIEHYLKTDTPFPDRETREETYPLSPAYKRFFERVLDYARETVRDPEGGQFHRRVRWWSALALLRSLASSPAAAADTLRNRARSSEAQDVEAADEIGRRSVLDVDIDESSQGADVTPGSDPGAEADPQQRIRRRLREMARTAESLKGAPDEKLQKGVRLVRELVDDGFSPIVFCRFIPTAEYLAAELRRRLGEDVAVTAVTGTLPAPERERRIQQLAQLQRRVLVCTDCLSEGINLQGHFDAVMHYDLLWNPTRHEQREGRVDRFNQRKPLVRVLTYYGIDNQIDGIVLDVLLRKHEKIRHSLGISVPVPFDTEKLVEAIFEGLLLREKAGRFEQQLTLFDQLFKPEKQKLHAQWERSAEREKRSRTLFVHETIQPEEVEKELNATREAAGSHLDVAQFVKNAVRVHHGTVSEGEPMLVNVSLSEAPRALRERLGKERLKLRFSLPVQEDETFVSRTHPITEVLANYVFDTALDPEVASPVKRCGAIRTRRVDTRTTLLLVRFRFQIRSITGEQVRESLAEDCRLLAFTGAPRQASWLDGSRLARLLEARPDANIFPGQATQFVQRVIEDYGSIQPHIEERARQLGQEVLAAHRRVRQAARMKGLRYRVEPKLPADLLGVYLLLPAGGLP
ncbi:MAG: helicase-related protein, partial [Acidobacteriota bacterium]